MKNNNCSEKMAFDTQAEAEHTATVAEFQHGSNLKTYKCGRCHLWHLASNYGDKHDD